MEKIVWSNDFSVGIPEIDNQHKQIINYINQIIDNPDISVSSIEFHNVLNEMLDYVKKHLHYEEKLLEKYQYPDIEKHKGDHFDFALKISEFAIDTMQKRKEMPAEFLEFLLSWWNHHILEEDMKFKPFLEAKEF